MNEASRIAAADAGQGAIQERIEVEPVGKRERRELYKKRVKIYPKRVFGRYRTLKWFVMAVTLGIYYLAPWIRWDRGPAAPDQAILIDIPARRFYFFFIEIWPQEFYYITGLLILAALGLFLVTAVAGRVWCGYTCPQTVWTDLFIAVERLVEGDRGSRMRLDKQPWTGAKIAKRTVKHGLWLLIAMLTGGAWVFYFADAPTLLGNLLTLQAPAVAYITIGVLTFTTYTLGGHMREQVCTYMCPWPRIQGGLLDEDSLVVTYHDQRGEPRGSHRKGESWEGRGHCIDCNLCVAACPMGIDIRDGQQLECITCALCIDACDSVMAKLDLPRGLIDYDTLANLERQKRGEPSRFRFVRPRTIIYAAVMSVVGLVMLVTLLSRDQLDLSVLRDRNPLFVRLSDGSIRNGYTVKIINKQHDQRTYQLTVEGVPVRHLQVIGLADGAEPRLEVGPDRLASYRVFVTVERDALQSTSTPVTFTVVDTTDGAEVAYQSVFTGPER